MIGFVLALAAGIAGAPASAAPASAVPMVPSEKAAACLFARTEPGTRALLRSEPGSADEQSALARLAAPASACGALPAPSVDESGAAFRSSLARAFMRKRLTDLHAGPNSNPNFSPNLFIVEKGFDSAGAMQRPYRLARCVIDVNLNGAARLVRTTPGGSGEKEALAALMPSLGSCVDRGQQFAMRPEVMRSAIDIVLTNLFVPLFDALPLNR
jgi:hypothetical protein